MFSSMAAGEFSPSSSWLLAVIGPGAEPGFF
jgi:hypothetical protein